MSIAGSPETFESCDTFSWLFSEPLSTITPDTQAIAPIPKSRALFIDNATDRVLTYASLREASLALAANLQGLRLNSEEITTLPPTPTCAAPEIAPIVLIQLPNSLAFPKALLGTLAVGLTATLVSPALTKDEVAWVLESSRPRCIITSQASVDTMRAAIAQIGGMEDVPLVTVDLDTDKYSLNNRPWTSTPTSLRTHTFNPRNRTAVILWSSGTSGRSKGVLLSHHALNFSVASLWHDSDFYLGRTQRWTGYTPFYHVFGLVNIALCAIPTGATVYVDRGFNLGTFLDTVARRRITYIHMAPPVAVMLAKSPVVESYARRGAFASVVSGVTGGAPLGDEVITLVYERLGFRVRRGYGLTEACSVSLQTGIGEEEMQSQKEDTGRPHWGVEIKIDTSGEVLVRSPCLLSAYIPHELTAAAVTDDGWFRTGDVGVLDEGRLRITDRMKEMIKVQGYQVAPAELEAVLCSHPEVVDAGVVGVWDAERATEWPRGYVVAAEGLGLEALARRLRGFVEERAARYKWLRGGLVFVSQIPKSPSGKILRRVLKEGVEGVEVRLYTPRAKL